MGPGAPLRPPTDLRLASLLVPGGAQVGVLCRLQVGLTLGTMTWQLTQAGCPPPKPPLPQKSLSTSPALQRKLPLCWETPLTCVPSSCEPSESLAEEKWCLAHSADEETEAASRPDTCASRAPPGGPRRAAASSPGTPPPRLLPWPPVLRRAAALAHPSASRFLRDLDTRGILNSLSPFLSRGPSGRNCVNAVRPTCSALPDTQ